MGEGETSIGRVYSKPPSTMVYATDPIGVSAGGTSPTKHDPLLNHLECLPCSLFSRHVPWKQCTLLNRTLADV